MCGSWLKLRQPAAADGIAGVQLGLGLAWNAGSSWGQAWLEAAAWKGRSVVPTGVRSFHKSRKPSSIDCDLAEVASDSVNIEHRQRQMLAGAREDWPQNVRALMLGHLRDTFSYLAALPCLFRATCSGLSSRGTGLLCSPETNRPVGSRKPNSMTWEYLLFIWIFIFNVALREMMFSQGPRDWKQGFSEKHQVPFAVPWISRSKRSQQ